MFQVVTSGLLGAMSSPAPGPQVAGSPASGVAAQDVPALTPEDVFGPPNDQNSCVGAAYSGVASAVLKPCCKQLHLCLGQLTLDLKLPWVLTRTWW